MLWGLVGLFVAAVSALPAWRLIQGWRLAREDDGLLLLMAQASEVPQEQLIAWLGEAIAAERLSRARPEHLAALELLLATELGSGRGDRKHDALVLYRRHLPGGGLWQKYLSGEDVLKIWAITAWQMGRHAVAREAIDAALERGSTNAAALRLRGLVERKLTADLEATAGWFARSLASSGPEELAFNTLRVACYLAQLRAERGEVDAGVAALGEAVTAFRATQPTLSRNEQIELAGFALWGVRMLCRLGRVAEARAAFDATFMPEAERGVAMAVEEARAELEGSEGDPARGIAQLEALVEEAHRRKDDDDLGEFLLGLAHLEARAGDRERCLLTLNRAREVFERTGSRADLLALEAAARRLGVAPRDAE